MKNEKGDKTIMKKVLLTSVLALSAIASVSYAATNGTPFNDATREFGNNTRFGARFNADKLAKPATPATPAKPATPATPAKPATPATPATPAKPEAPKKPVAVVQVQQPKGDKKDGVLQEVSTPAAPKKPVAVTAEKDLPSEKNVTGTTNSRYGSASQEEKTAKDGKKYETFKAVETYGNTNYSYNGSYDDGKRLVTVDPNSRYGSASQKEETAKDGQQYETFKTVETFVSTNYSSVVNQ